MASLLTDSAREITAAALAAVRPERLVRQAVRRAGPRLEILGTTVDLGRVGRIALIAFGKAAPALASEFSAILGDRLDGGLVTGLPGSSLRPERLAFFEAPHPLPDERSERAGRAALEIARKMGPRDLLFLLASGGGSAQLCLPQSGVTLEDKIETTSLLLAGGADIHELNTVRKHLSAIKGGRLAGAAHPARVFNILVSDVVGDDPGVIASGPGYGDSSTYADAIRVLEARGLAGRAPAAAGAVLEAGRKGEIPETPKPGDPIFERVATFLIGRNRDALDAARDAARARGCEASVLTDSETGEARDAAGRSAADFLKIASSRTGSRPPLALISGGEHTVRVRGRGRGGRNQEFVLAFLLALESETGADGRLAGRDWLVLSLGTDGIDGPTDAAGAMAGPEVLMRARAAGLDARAFLDDNDSYAFFKKTGGLIITGPTGTNVMDLRVLLLSPRAQESP